MRPPPTNVQDAIPMADWLEFNALANEDGQISLGHMFTAVRAGALLDRNAMEELTPQVVAELEARRNRMGRGYPFNLRGSSLEARWGVGRIRTSTYAFCVALSVLSWEERKVPGYFPERVFEEISAVAAQSYIGGEAIRFGWPRSRTGVPTHFKDAIKFLSKRMAEGAGLKEADLTGNEKDDSVDVIAWKTLDSRPGKVIMFGACASGVNWEQKLKDCNPETFCERYFNEVPHPKPLKAFFTPSVVAPARWRRHTQDAGVLFDRCRISAIVPDLPVIKRHGDPEKWMARAFSHEKG